MQTVLYVLKSSITNFPWKYVGNTLAGNSSEELSKSGKHESSLAIQCTEKHWQFISSAIFGAKIASPCLYFFLLPFESLNIKYIFSFSFISFS